MTDLFGAASMDSFSTHFIANSMSESIGFEINVRNEAEKSSIYCSGGSEHKCTVQYRFRYTPLLFDVSPSNVHLDQQLSLHVNPLGANNWNVVKSDADPVDFIKFSGTRTDSEGLFDNTKRLTHYTVGELPTRAGDQHTGD